MTLKKALIALIEGKKIRHAHWPKREYIFLNGEDYIYDNEGYVATKINLNICNWAFFTEPPKLHDWQWAIEQMQSGYSVRWHEWPSGHYMFLDKGVFMERFDVHIFTLEHYTELGWELFEVHS